MALFSTTRTVQSNNLVEFRAGKMLMRGTMVHADKRKGLVSIHQSDDSLMHFCWKDRTSGAVDDDLIVFPDDCEFVPVKECTTGRVFLLKFKNSSRKLFFWMQEPKSDKDDEFCRKVNDLLNNPPAPGSARTMGSRGGATAAATGPEHLSDQFSMMNQLLNLGGAGNTGDDRMDIQNVLAGMDQQQLMQLLNLVGGGALGGVDTPSLTSGTTSAAATTTVTTPTSATVAATATQPSVTAAAPASIAVSNAPRPVASAAGAGQKPIQVADLRNILSSLSAPAATSQADSVDLEDVLSSKSVESTVMGKPEHIARLLPHLPNEEPISADQVEVVSTLRSPQFRQAVGTFGMAFQSGQLGPPMRQFGFSDKAVDAVAKGDIQSVAEILEKEHSQATAAGAGSSTDKEKKPKKEDDDEIKEPAKKKDKTDDDQMDLD